MTNPQLGSSFDSFLEEAGLTDEVECAARKRVLAWGLTREMKRQSLSTSEMATRMGTSEAELGRLLDPGNDQVPLTTLVEVAHALGREPA